MAGITRCSPIRILSSFFIILGVSASVAVFINHSGSSSTATHHQDTVVSDFLYQKRELIRLHTVQPLRNSSVQQEGDHQQGEVTRNVSNLVRQVNNTITANVDPPNLLVQDIEGLKAFVFFIGYPRSGHSIIASMIDAHPNAIMSHEFNLFEKLTNKPQYRTLLEKKANLLNTLYQDSYKQSVSGWRSNNTHFNLKGYTLELSNKHKSWQGRFTSLSVIGDKSGGTTARAYRDNPHMFKLMYNSVMDLLKVPMRVIHTVRNPYDMIATRLLYRHSETRGVKGKFNETHKLEAVDIKQAMKGLHSEAKAVSEMMKDCNLSVFEIHHSDFVQDPKIWMRRLCDFLGLECSQSYLQMCVESTFKTLSKTRYSLEWKDSARLSLDNMIREFPFFQRYSYESD